VVIVIILMALILSCIQPLKAQHVIGFHNIIGRPSDFTFDLTFSAYNPNLVSVVVGDYRDLQCVQKDLQVATSAGPNVCKLKETDSERGEHGGMGTGIELQVYLSLPASTEEYFVGRVDRFHQLDSGKTKLLDSDPNPPILRERNLTSITFEPRKTSKVTVQIQIRNPSKSSKL
jgi:hypothetical protein